jgi:mycofactocin biosynthesis protein MftB
MSAVSAVSAVEVSAVSVPAVEVSAVRVPACAASPVGVSVDRAYRVHPNVAVRPEPFGALVYHYGNRKLVFLKSKLMVSVVQSLANHACLGAALDAAGVPVEQHNRYVDALASLFASDMIVENP